MIIYDDALYDALSEDRPERDTPLLDRLLSDVHPGWREDLDIPRFGADE